ncbi:tripartite motif-containing protein 49D-like [Macrotis lagotis]|uniref:tripartite motif-containing protein 49D-like n=1 Tax=Macrotis lagotis TaxID=92651 RepID=UPI003D69A455
MNEMILEQEVRFWSYCYFCSSWSKQIIAECGHPICSTCFKKKVRYSCCPPCWKYSQLRAHQAKIVMYPEGESVCETHREDHKLFCEDFKMLLCETCSKVDHEHHIHWPVAVAALKCREKIKEMLYTMYHGIKKIKTILSQEKKNSVSRAKMWTEHKNTSLKMFYKGNHAIQEYLQSEKSKTRTAPYEKITVEMQKEMFKKVYQKMLLLGAKQEYMLMKQRKEWETMMSRQSRCLTDKIKELEEMMKKPNVELLQESVQTYFQELFYWFHKQQIFQPFIPRFDNMFNIIADQFVHIYQSIAFLWPEEMEEGPDDLVTG